MEDRFFRTLGDDACIEKVHELIDLSLNNWRTRQYDQYQKFANGIL